MFMIDAKLLKAVAMGAGGAKSQEALRNVCIDCNGIAATDSFRIHYAAIETEGAPEPENPLLLDAATLAKIKPPKSGVVTFEEDGGKWIVGGDAILWPCDLRYPNWRSIVDVFERNAGGEPAPVKLSADLVEKTSKAFRAIDRNAGMLFTPAPMGKPVIVAPTVETPLRVAIMPLR